MDVPSMFFYMPEACVAMTSGTSKGKSPYWCYRQDSDVLRVAMRH